MPHHNVIQFPRKDRGLDKIVCALKDAKKQHEKLASLEITPRLINQTINWWMEFKLGFEFLDALKHQDRWLGVDYSWGCDNAYDQDLDVMDRLVKAAFPSFQERLKELGISVYEGNVIDQADWKFRALFLIDMADLKRVANAEPSTE